MLGVTQPANLCTITVSLYNGPLLCSFSVAVIRVKENVRWLRDIVNS